LPVADKWNVEQPQTVDQVRAFYGNTPQYFYDLVKWNATPAFQRILNCLVNVQGEKVLEIGGGLGTITEFLATHGNRVDYYDVPGVLSEFAKWRFARLGRFSQNIRMVERGEAINSNGTGYDRVVAIDVIEHLHPDEFDSVVDGLATGLRPGGVLFAHNNWSDQNGMYPFHFDHTARWAAFVARHGLVQVDDFTWKKPVDGEESEI